MKEKIIDRKIDGEVFARFTKSARSQQGMAIWGDFAFLYYHGGLCDVMDLRRREVFASFEPESYTGSLKGPLANHANMAVFGGDDKRNSEDLPLIYITAGNSGEVDDEGNYYAHCAVERIRMECAEGAAESFSSRLVQRIYFNDAGFEREGKFKYNGLPFEGVCWGWPAFFPDGERDKLYILSARYRTNGTCREFDSENAYIVTTFTLPSTAREKVILTPNDILDQFTFEYDVEVTQGGTLCGNKIIYSFGFGREGSPDKIRVIDLDKKAVVDRIDLSESIFCNEEIESVGIYRGRLLCNTNAGGIYDLGEF